MKLRDLCLQIKAGYAENRSMFDPSMTEWIADLAGRTDEILSLIDPATSADDAAVRIEPLTLQIGKTYMNRHGERCRIERHNSANDDLLVDDRGRWYYENGNHYASSGASPLDLVAEALDPGVSATVAAAGVIGGAKPKLPPGNPPANEIDRQYGHNSAAAIPHADLIRAVLDGKAVQYMPTNGPGYGTWCDFQTPKQALGTMTTSSGFKYRLKPERYTYEVEPVCEDGFGDLQRCAPHQAQAWGLYRRPVNPDKYGRKLAEHIADFNHEDMARKAARLLEQEQA